jgi:hypothetical protein
MPLKWKLLICSGRASFTLVSNSRRPSRNRSGLVTVKRKFGKDRSVDGYNTHSPSRYAMRCSPRSLASSDCSRASGHLVSREDVFCTQRSSDIATTLSDFVTWKTNYSLIGWYVAQLQLKTGGPDSQFWGGDGCDCGCGGGCSRPPQAKAQMWLDHGGARRHVSSGEWGFNVSQHMRRLTRQEQTLSIGFRCPLNHALLSPAHDRPQQPPDRHATIASPAAP